MKRTHPSRGCRHGSAIFTELRLSPIGGLRRKSQALHGKVSRVEGEGRDLQESLLNLAMKRAIIIANAFSPDSTDLGKRGIFLEHTFTY